MHDVTDKIDYVGIAKRLLKCLSSKNTAKERKLCNDDEVFVDVIATSETAVDGANFFVMKKMILGKYNVRHIIFTNVSGDISDLSSEWWKAFLESYVKLCGRDQLIDWWIYPFEDPMKEIGSVAELEIKLAIEGF